MHVPQRKPIMEQDLAVLLWEDNVEKNIIKDGKQALLQISMSCINDNVIDDCLSVLICYKIRLKIDNYS